MTLTQVTKAGLHDIALDHVFTIGASGTDHYTFQGEGLNGTVNDPTLYLTRGKTYRFENGTGAHAIRIQSADNGTNGTLYNTGVTNNNTTGTVIVEVQHDAPDVLYYQCASHANMKGTIYITGALADGNVTTAKIAADAITGAKIADDAVDNEHLAANSVRTEQIQNSKVTLAKLPLGTSSNDGKFLRANNGGQPTFEVVNTDLVADTTPQLGGDLDVNSQDIVSTSNADIDIIPNGTGKAVIGGVNGIRLPMGTTGERVNSEGVLRYNSTLDLPEYYNGTDWIVIDTPPTITSVTPVEVDSTQSGNVTFTINGARFQSGVTVKIIASNGTEITPSPVTRVSASQLTAVTAISNFSNAQEPYDVKVTNVSGLSATLDDVINVDTAPTWTTSAGSLGTIYDTETGTHATVGASDADSDTIAYSLVSGTLGGLSLNSSTGVISGDPTNVTSDTTHSFTLRATANSKTVDRAFSIIVKQGLDGSTNALRAYSAQDLVNSGTGSGNKYVDINGTGYLMYFDNTDKFGTGVTGWLRYDHDFMDANGSNLNGDNYSIGSAQSAGWNSGYEGWYIGNNSVSSTGQTGISHVRMRMPRMRYAKITDLTGVNSGQQVADDGNVENSGHHFQSGTNMVSYAINRSPNTPNPDGYPIGIYDSNLSNSYDTTNKSQGSTGNLILPYPGGLFSSAGTTNASASDFNMVSFSSFNSSGEMRMVSWTGDAGYERVTFSNFEMWIH